MTPPKEKPESKVEPLSPDEQPVIPDLTPEEASELEMPFVAYPGEFDHDELEVENHDL